MKQKQWEQLNGTTRSSSKIRALSVERSTTVHRWLNCTQYCNQYKVQYSPLRKSGLHKSSTTILPWNSSTGFQHHQSLNQNNNTAAYQYDCYTYILIRIFGIGKELMEDWWQKWWSQWGFTVRKKYVHPNWVKHDCIRQYTVRQYSIVLQTCTSTGKHSGCTVLVQGTVQSTAKIRVTQIEHNHTSMKFINRISASPVTQPEQQHSSISIWLLHLHSDSNFWNWERIDGRLMTEVMKSMRVHCEKKICASKLGETRLYTTVYGTTVQYSTTNLYQYWKT